MSSSTIFKAVFRTFSRYSSSLYVTGDKASKTFSVLTPHIDFEERIANRSELSRNIKSRNLNITLETVESRWIFYTHLRDQKIALQKTRDDISKEITQLLKDPEKNKAEIDRLKIHAEHSKNDLTNLKDFLYGVEESAALQALSLPNKLHTKTPLQDEVIVKQAPFKNTPTKCHIDLYPGYFNITDNFVYLLDDAALFEQAVVSFVHEKLLKIDFVQLSNPNFSAGVICEGCANRNEQLFEINAETVGVEMFLTGSACLNAFMAYFARLHVKPTQLPQKLFSIGKIYQKNTNEASTNLFNLSQNTSINIFCLVKNSSSSDDLCNKIVKYYFEIYDELELNVRSVLLSAKDLQMHESLRYSFQMYSNSMGEFVEVGYISMCDDFLSKRLLIIYDECKSRNYAHVISGCVLNVHKTVGCLIENNDLVQKGIMTEMLKKFL